MNITLDTYIWWETLDHDLKELLKQSLLLSDTAREWESNLLGPTKNFHDYAFIVFPAAKAYEGFLKNFFLDMNFITQKEFSGKRFRIGKALNPTLYSQEMKKHGRYKKLRLKLSVYDKVVAHCNGVELADTMWTTWKECRNILFHWFPNEKNAISLEEAESKVAQIIDTINLSYKECKI